MWNIPNPSQPNPARSQRRWVTLYKNPTTIEKGNPFRSVLREYQRQVVANARVVSAGLEKAGYRVVTGGTDTHLVLVDTSSKKLSGAKAEREELPYIYDTRKKVWGGARNTPNFQSRCTGWSIWSRNPVC